MDWLDEAIKELNTALAKWHALGIVDAKFNYYQERITTDAVTNINMTLLNKLIAYSLRYMEPTNAPYVYVLQSGDYYKIGIARDVQHRISQLQIGNPIQLRHIFSARKARATDIEKAIHKGFSYKHVRGEWFKLSDADIADIRSQLAFL